MKMRIMSILTVIFLLAVAVPSYTVNASDIKVIVDGKTLQLDQPPVIEKGRVLVPMRVIFEALDFQVTWYAEKKQIKAHRLNEKESCKLYLGIDDPNLTVDYVEFLAEGNRFALGKHIFDVPPLIRNGRTLVPTRGIAEALGCLVEWKPDIQTVVIDTSNARVEGTDDDNNSGSSATYPVPTNAETVTEEEKPKARQLIPPLTEPPEVGVTLGNILKNPNDTSLTGWEQFTEPYAIPNDGECVWYAEGRFREVYGIGFPIEIGNAKRWIENIQGNKDYVIITDITKIKEQSIAVFKNKTDETHPGHVVFIEHVEMDNENNPLYVYFTEANGIYTLNKGQFNYGYDGIVQKVSFNDFSNKKYMQLLGYILPKL